MPTRPRNLILVAALLALAPCLLASSGTPDADSASMADSTWVEHGSEDGRFTVRTPPRWFYGSHSQYERHQLRLSTRPVTAADTVLAKGVLLLSARLFGQGAQLVSAEMGGGLPPGDTPVALWMENMGHGQGTRGDVRQAVMEGMASITQEPVVDSMVTLEGHELLWLESLRPPRDSAAVHSPALRMISTLYEIDSTFYRWTATGDDERPGVSDLLRRVLRTVRVR